MKTTKRLASLLLALVMVFALTATAFAAENDGSITIENATVGETYAVYKVFDLTYSENAVAYSYTKTGETDTLYAALTGSGSPFTLTATTIENKYNVSLVDGADEAAVSTFLKNIASELTMTGSPVVATTNTVVFDNLPYGYYYVTSSLGTIVTIDSAKPAVNVIDKNQKPGWDPEDPTNPDGTGEQGKFVATSESGSFGKTSTAAINDTAYFKINAYAPKYAGDKLVATYIFTDTLTDGFTINDDLKVLLGGVALEEDVDYSLVVDGQNITVVVNAGYIADYPVEAHLSITYSAMVDADAVYDNVNTANMTWTVFPNNDDGDPDTGETPYNPNDPENPSTDPKDPTNPGETRTDTYVFGFNVQKYKESAAEGNELTGAKFKLYTAATEGTEIAVVKVSDGVYRVAEADETGVEIEAGHAQIFGLDAKTYYLEETFAPDGYNILTARVEVSIPADAESNTNGILNSTVDVINNAGTLLPATGGMGTTMFYVLGGLLVLVAVVVLVSRRRVDESEG